MKGFIHIVEIIIVALTLLTVISLTTGIPRMEYDWSRIRVGFYGNDLLFSLDQIGPGREGINWLNKTQVNQSIQDLLPRNLGFDLKVKNAIKPVISIGCACPLGIISTFEGFLNDFELNGVNTSFRLEWIDPSDPTFPITLDFILFFNMNIPDNKRGELENYLKQNKGVLEISKMDGSVLAGAIYRDIFSLQWIGEGITLAGEGGFQETDPGKGNYNIRKYFYHVPSRTGLASDSAPQGVVSCTGSYVSGSFTIREQDYKVWVIDNTTTIPGSCNLSLYVDKNGNNQLSDSGDGPYGTGETLELDGFNFLVRNLSWNYLDLLFQESPEYVFSPATIGETVYPRDNSSRKVVLKRTDVSYPDGRSVPLSTINYNIINGKGRAAWLSNSTFELKSDIEHLLRNLIIWTAGDEYLLIKGRETTNPSTFYLFKTLDQDMFQPLELALTLGYLQ